MISSNLFQYIDPFFNELEMFEDTFRGHHYKNYLQASIMRFMEDESEERAFDVFRAFFDVYRISSPDNKTSFFDLVDVLHQFEEHAALLVDKQRDHLVHSVNVFLTGLAIYANNPLFREAFLSAVPEQEYVFAYKTRNEEFLYRWGIASLLHDIGYPVEISYNQINRFLKLTQMQEEDFHLRAKLSMEGFDQYNQIQHVLPEEEFSSSFLKAYPHLATLDVYKPTDLMAAYIHIHHQVDLDAITKSLDEAVDMMAASGFVDHGFFSSLILLRWYGALIQKNHYSPEYFFWPVLDSATAILLHNYYKNSLQREPYMLGPMSPHTHPIAYLLILCDELQEWNREAHGILTRNSIHAESTQFGELRNRLYVNFVTNNGSLPDGFCEKKKKALLGLLDLDTLFPSGIKIENTSLDDMNHLVQDRQDLPRPLIDNVERLAIAIHTQYNDEQLRLFPDRPLKYPSYSDLPVDLQYSNIRQAMSIFDKISMMGYKTSEKPSDSTIRSFPDDIVEQLAQVEHEEWVRERIELGWHAGDNDSAQKTTPYLIPYSELPDDIKELDRSAVRNIPVLLERVGLIIIKN